MKFCDEMKSDPDKQLHLVPFMAVIDLLNRIKWTLDLNRRMFKVKYGD